ncbi:uncharacterized protein LOC110441514 isoform X2 [Mizuhopecten yessoensis]|uniref:uncharacterized protein LOC110441514 isoform X2 n=1 Tax=Mizuhopecten yessoensis TaxID=6573 RepID=UPI000B45A50A|nr:uncharacterized protein LOC110441514 isoform X2 [Mizuhopecten yessoensis]
MLDQPQRWATLTNFGNIPSMKEALLSRQQSDRRILNMKLKQRALTGKPQNKRFVSSASTFQGREPRRYPMEFSRDDSTRAGKQHQALRKQLEQRVHSAKIDSGSLRQYSLHLFDSVVQNFNKNDSNNKQKQKPKKQPCMSNKNDDEEKEKKIIRPQTAVHNGPSHDGSLLYNKRGKVLNSIRLRPQSEPVCRYNHEKGKIVPPEIQRTLCQSNSEFRVLTTPMSVHPPSPRSRSSSISDFKLVPLNGTGSVSEISSIHDFNTDGAVRVELNSENGFDEIDELETSRTSSQISNDIAFRTRNMPSGTVHFYSLEYESSVEESIPDVPTLAEVKPPPPPPEEPKAKAKKGKQRASAKKKKEAEPSPPPPPEPVVVKEPEVKKPLRGPKCWVDDATVTSECDDKAENEQTTTTDGNRPVSAAKSILEKRATDTPEPINNAVVQQDQAEHAALIDSDVEGADEGPSYLPKFLCPSSVRKSKHAAVKDWLATTNFSRADRSVPLL